LAGLVRSFGRPRRSRVARLAGLGRSPLDRAPPRPLRGDAAATVARARHAAAGRARAGRARTGAPLLRRRAGLRRPPPRCPLPPARAPGARDWSSAAFPALSDPVTPPLGAPRKSPAGRWRALLAQDAASPVFAVAGAAMAAALDQERGREGLVQAVIEGPAAL